MPFARIGSPFGNPGKRKGGSSYARAERARKAHQRRQAKHVVNPSAGRHYKGSARHRTKPSWFW